jgi:hypothetical protein
MVSTNPVETWTPPIKREKHPDLHRYGKTAPHIKIIKVSYEKIFEIEGKTKLPSQHRRNIVKSPQFVNTAFYSYKRLIYIKYRYI